MKRGTLMFERILAIFGAMCLLEQLGKEQPAEEKAKNTSCGCGCLCLIGLWFLGTLLLKSCGG